MYRRYVAYGLTWQHQDRVAVERHVACAEDSKALREALSARDLVAFVGNGAILPRCVTLEYTLGSTSMCAIAVPCVFR